MNLMPTTRDNYSQSYEPGSLGLQESGKAIFFGNYQFPESEWKLCEKFTEILL